jgi:hypothetical protein
MCEACHHLCLACAALDGTKVGADVRAACAKVCLECAAVCEKDGDETCKACAKNCRECAAACSAERK